MTTMLNPPEWEFILTNQPITAEEFLELYRPAREYLRRAEHILITPEHRDVPIFTDGYDALEEFVVNLRVCKNLSYIHPRLPIVLEKHLSEFNFGDWKLIFEVIEAYTIAYARTGVLLAEELIISAFADIA